MPKMLRKIISGGQTGADRAGLDFAIETGLEHGGYVPRGRKAEDGRIDDRYNMVELSTTSYPARTRRNIEESDGTVIFSLERLLSGGSKLTWKGSVVLCDSVTFPIEKVFVEFEDEHLAISFVEGIKTETAIIALDEDTSINAAPRAATTSTQFGQIQIQLALRDLVTVCRTLCR